MPRNASIIRVKKKLLFVQLPIPRLTMSREDHNIPVAAFYLQSYLLEQKFAPQLDIRILDPFMQNCGAIRFLNQTTILELSDDDSDQRAFDQEVC